jgi:hypothetical protein
MAFVPTDWSIAANGDIRYIGNDHNGATPSYATVIEFHRALQDFADDASASGDDLMDISRLTPSDRSTDNIITLLNSYNIDATTSEHLYNGSIIQNSGADVYDGIVNFGNPEVELGVIQNGVVIADDWWNQGGFHGAATGGSTSTLVDTGSGWIVDQWVGYVVRNVTTGGQGLVTSNTADTLVFNSLMYGSATSNTNTSADVYFISKGLNADANNGISHRFMIPVIVAGTPVDNRKLIGFARTFQKTFSEFTINATSNGNNVLAVSDGGDLNNATAPNSLYNSVGVVYVSPFTTIANATVGYIGLDVNNDTVNEFFWSQYDRGTATINQFYEYTKYITRYKGETGTLYGLATALFRGVNTELTVTPGTGTWAQPELVTWTGGSGQIFAVNSTTGTITTKVWLQVLTGSAPTSGTITGAGGATATVTAATSRALSYPFSGQSTGSALIGGYGLGLQTADLTASDLLRALDNITYQPPNNVTFSVGGLVIGEDRVLVTSESGGVINKTQLALNATLSGATVGTVVTSTAIPTDTPSAGTIRIVNDSGFDRLLNYTSFVGSTFTLDTTYSFAGVDENDSATAGNGLYITYIDKLATSTTESFTVVFTSVRPLFIRVRDGAGTPIKTFETTGSLGSAGGSTTAIRTSDL